MEIKEVRPAIVKNYERLCHDTGKENFLLPLRNFPRPSEGESLWSPRLQRAIGVIYRPETEIASHYFQAVLPRQFDEHIWLDQTRAVTPFDTDKMASMPDLSVRTVEPGGDQRRRRLFSSFCYNSSELAGNSRRPEVH